MRNLMAYSRSSSIRRQQAGETYCLVSLKKETFVPNNIRLLHVTHLVIV